MPEAVPNLDGLVPNISTLSTTQLAKMGIGHAHAALYGVMQVAKNPAVLTTVLSTVSGVPMLLASDSPMLQEIGRAGIPDDGTLSNLPGTGDPESPSVFGSYSSNDFDPVLTGKIGDGKIKEVLRNGLQFLGQSVTNQLAINAKAIPTPNATQSSSNPGVAGTTKVSNVNPLALLNPSIVATPTGGHPPVVEIGTGAASQLMAAQLAALSASLQAALTESERSLAEAKTLKTDKARAMSALDALNMNTEVAEAVAANPIAFNNIDAFYASLVPHVKNASHQSLGEWMKWQAGTMFSGSGDPDAMEGDWMTDSMSKYFTSFSNAAGTVTNKVATAAKDSWGQMSTTGKTFVGLLGAAGVSYGAFKMMPKVTQLALLRKLGVSGNDAMTAVQESGSSVGIPAAFSSNTESGISKDGSNAFVPATAPALMYVIGDKASKVADLAAFMKTRAIGDPLTGDPGRPTLLLGAPTYGQVIVPEGVNMVMVDPGVHIDKYTGDVYGGRIHVYENPLTGDIDSPVIYPISAPLTGGLWDVVKKVGSAIGSVASSGIGKVVKKVGGTVLRAIPGVGTAIAIGGAIKDVADATGITKKVVSTAKDITNSAAKQLGYIPAPDPVAPAPVKVITTPSGNQIAPVSAAVPFIAPFAPIENMMQASEQSTYLEQGLNQKLPTAGTNSSSQASATQSSYEARMAASDPGSFEDYMLQHDPGDITLSGGAFMGDPYLVGGAFTGKTALVLESLAAMGTAVVTRVKAWFTAPVAATATSKAIPWYRSILSWMWDGAKAFGRMSWIGKAFVVISGVQVAQSVKTWFASPDGRTKISDLLGSETERFEKLVNDADNHDKWSEEDKLFYVTAVGRLDHNAPELMTPKMEEVRDDIKADVSALGQPDASGSSWDLTKLMPYLVGILGVSGAAFFISKYLKKMRGEEDAYEKVIPVSLTGDPNIDGPSLRKSLIIIRVSIPDSQWEREVVRGKRVVMAVARKSPRVITSEGARIIDRAKASSVPVSLKLDSKSRAASADPMDLA